MIIKAQARRILDVAREALAKRLKPQSYLLDGHLAEELDVYARSHAVDLDRRQNAREKRLRSIAHWQYD